MINHIITDLKMFDIFAVICDILKDPVEKYNNMILYFSGRCHKSNITELCSPVQMENVWRLNTIKHSRRAQSMKIEQ